MNRAVAIDGPAASGKSTVAKRLAHTLGLVMVNSGEMYRAVTWQILNEGINPEDVDAVVVSLQNMEIVCGVDDSHSIISINGRLLTSELRSAEVNHTVSIIAAIPAVRERLVQLQRDSVSYTHLTLPTIYSV